jgi:hypothetical protein
MKLSVVFLFLISCCFSNAQKLSESDKEKEKDRVRAFTFKEFDSIQLRFNKGLKDMKLTDDEEEEYLNIISSCVAKLGRLDDLDKNYTNTEMSEKFYEYVNKLDNKVKSVLTKKQYDTHVKNFGAIKKSIEKKILKIE